MTGIASSAAPAPGASNKERDVEMDGRRLPISWRQRSHSRERAVAELKRIHLTKTDLDRISGDERFFYLMAGHLANDVNILGKLVIVAFNTAYRDGVILKDEPHGQAGLAQLFLLLKLLAGRLHEASRLIDAHYFAKGLHRKYESLMAKKAREARQQFSKYFGHDTNVISHVRNKVAFHFDREEIDKLYAALDDDYSFVTYVGEYL
jgi:hypothetical protein